MISAAILTRQPMNPLSHSQKQNGIAVKTDLAQKQFSTSIHPITPVYAV
jgi:hypothetical protein